MIKKYLKPEFIIPAMIFLFLIYILLLNPIIGRHNNGDFGRTMIFSGLNDLSLKYEDVYDNFVHSKYHINLLFFLPWYFDWTSEVLLVKSSIVLNVLFTGFNFKMYDIRFLTIIYIALFTFSIFLIIKYSDKFIDKPFFKWLLGGIIFLIFTDIGYVSYFNSFFGEAGSYVFLFLTIGSAMFLLGSEKPSKFKIRFFMISSIFFLTAKQQNIPALIFMGLFYMRLLSIYKEKEYRKVLLTYIAASVLICGLTYASIGKVTNICNKYQTLFAGILKDSPTPEKDLESMGIDKSFAKLAGTVFYTPNLPIDPTDKSLDSTLYNKISSLKVLKFYILHPQRLYMKIDETCRSAFTYFKIDKGNYEKGAYEKSAKVYNSFRSWISVKYQTVFQNIFFVLPFTFLYFAVLLFNYIKARNKIQRAHLELLIIIGLTGFSQCILPVIGSGSGDLAKHLFLFNFCYDIMFSIALMWIAYIVLKLTNKIFGDNISI